MIFGVIEIEDVIQVNDKTRIDVSKTYISPDEASITLIEIEPEAGAGFIDVTSTRYLDWQYSLDGDKAISLRVTTDGAPELFASTLPVISEADDRLFSDDNMLTPHESEILKYIQPGRNSWKDKHRESQRRIIAYLDEKKIWKDNGDKYTKEDILDLDEVRDWSKFMTLMNIFEDLSNAIDDIFSVKAQKYRDLMGEARNRSTLRLDTNGDGVYDQDEDRSIDLYSSRLKRE